MRTKRILKLYNKITQIAQKGKDAIIEYYKFIDDTIDNGEYSLLEDIFINFYNTDIRMYNSISIFKRKSFEIARFNTNSNFQYKLKTYYDVNNVYQVGKNIFDGSTNDMLGEFSEIDRVGEVFYLGVTYSYYPENIYYKDPALFRKLNEAMIVELQVYIYDINETVLFNDPTMLLLDKYKSAVTLLLAIEALGDNEYIDSNFIDNYFE